MTREMTDREKIEWVAYKAGSLSKWTAKSSMIGGLKYFWEEVRDKKDEDYGNEVIRQITRPGSRKKVGGD